MAINAEKLDKELKDAGIPIHGCSSTGRVDFKSEATQEQKDLAAQIVNNHSSDWYVEKRRKAYKSIEDQLDMIYWDNVNGTTTWIDHITQVKNTYPKS